MEEVSGKELDIFFEQWLYKPGIFKLDGKWKYDRESSEIIISLNQVQTDGSLFEMPIEIAIDFGEKPQQIDLVHIKGESNSYRLKVDKEPIDVILDPNYLVLMNTNFKRE